MAMPRGAGVGANEIALPTMTISRRSPEDDILAIGAILYAKFRIEATMYFLG